MGGTHHIIYENLILKIINLIRVEHITVRSEGIEMYNTLKQISSSSFHHSFITQIPSVHIGDKKNNLELSTDIILNFAYHVKRRML